MKQLFIFIPIFLYTITSQANVLSAGLLLNACSNPSTNFVCENYLMGTISGVLIADSAHQRPKLCANTQSIGVHMETVKQFINQNPASHKEHAVDVIYLAMTRNFSCEK